MKHIVVKSIKYSMMDLNEITQRLNHIVDNIALVNAQVEGMSFEDFRKNEPVKETTYEYLQEIGQAARELSNEQKMPPELNVEPLVVLRNARYNQEAEVGHQQVFNLIQHDLKEIADQIEQSDIYQNNLSI